MMDIEEIKKSIPNSDELDNITNLFKVLGDSTRTKILYTLIKQELCVGDICLCVGMNKSAVSHQLRILKDSKLVKVRKDGKEVYYSFDDDHISTIFNTAIAHIEEDR